MAESTGQGVDQSLRELGRFFMGTSDVHATARRVGKLMEEAGIDYAVAGALALNAHGYRRATEDVAVLITREGLARFKELWLGRGYVEVRTGGKPIRDTETRVRIDFLIAGDFPGDGRPKSISFPVPREASLQTDAFPIVALNRMIELKLASGMTAPDRLKDLADVQELIRALKLGKEMSEQLDPFVREKFLELWDGVQHSTSDDY